MHTQTHMHTHRHTYAHTQTHTHTDTHMHTHRHTCTHTDTHMYTCTHVTVKQSTHIRCYPVSTHNWTTCQSHQWHTTSQRFEHYSSWQLPLQWLLRRQQSAADTFGKTKSWLLQELSVMQSSRTSFFNLTSFFNMHHVWQPHLVTVRDSVSCTANNHTRSTSHKTHLLHGRLCSMSQYNCYYLSTQQQHTTAIGDGLCTMVMQCEWQIGNYIWLGKS